jgi:hypothetical protein
MSARVLAKDRSRVAAAKAAGSHRDVGLAAASLFPDGEIPFGPFERTLDAAIQVEASYRFLRMLVDEMSSSPSAAAIASRSPIIKIEVRACLGWLPYPMLVVSTQEETVLTMTGVYARYIGFQQSPAVISVKNEPMGMLSTQEFAATWKDSIPLFGMAKTPEGKRQATRIENSAADVQGQVLKLYSHFSNNYRQFLKGVQSEHFYQEIFSATSGEAATTLPGDVTQVGSVAVTDQEDGIASLA